MALNAFIEYLSLEKNYSRHTVLAYKTDIEACAVFLGLSFEGTSVENANYSQLRTWIVHLVNQGLTNRSVNRKIASLRAYYLFLLKTGYINANPLANHKALKTPKKLEVPFSEAEMEKVLESAPLENTFESVRDKLIIELFYATGIRRSELVNLKVSDIDFSNHTIKVLGKRNKERILPLLPFLKDSIYQYLQYRGEVVNSKSADNLILVKNGDKIYETLVYRIINSYFSKASSKAKKSPHVLRHTFATHLLNQGASLNSVKELLGHSSLASTQVYTHSSIAELKKVHNQAHPRNKQ